MAAPRGLIALRGLVLIEQGKATKALDSEIDSTIAKFVEHVERYGEDKCKKMKAVVTLKVEIQCVGADKAFVVMTDVASKMPSRPKGGSIAIMSEDAVGKGLFVRPSGSSADHPDQRVLATDDGRVADLKTGEPRAPVAPLPGGVRPADQRTVSAGA